jgi:hypothetical protein
VIVLDARNEGRNVGSIATGRGLDNIDYDQETGMLYAAAAEDANLTIAQVDDTGKPTRVALVATVKGARSVVAGRHCAYVIDPLGGRILKVERR